MDPLCSAYYARTLSVTDIVEMKSDYHCVDFIDHEGDYGAYLQWIMTFISFDI